MSNVTSLESRLLEISKAPRVTELDVEENIASCFFFTAADAVGDIPDQKTKEALSILTICVLVTKSGFIATGVSACASPENYNKEIGQEIARRNARSEIWGHMGYELRSKLHQEQETDFVERARKELKDLNDRIMKLSLFLDSEQADHLSTVDLDRLKSQRSAMTAYSAILGARVQDMK